MEVVKCKYTVYLDEAFYMWQLRHRLLYETVGTMTWRKREIYVYVLNKSKVLVIKGKYTSGLPMNETDKNQLQNDGWGCSLVSTLSSANICAVLHVVLMSRRQTVFTNLPFSYLYEQINKCWQSIIKFNGKNTNFLPKRCKLKLKFITPTLFIIHENTKDDTILRINTELYKKKFIW